MDSRPSGFACGRLVDPYDGAMAAPLLRSAAFFDLDKTIIAKSSTLAFSKPFQAGGLISRRAVLRSAYAQFVYLVGGADHDQMEKMRQFMSQLVRRLGRRRRCGRSSADTLHNIVDPLVYDEAVSLIEEHHLAGRDVIIVSTSGTEVVEPIGEMLGADSVVATPDGGRRRQVHRRASTTTPTPRRRPAAIRELAEERGYDLDRCYAYSDSVTDVTMLEVVGHPHAVNPDKELRRHRAATGAGRSSSSPSPSRCAAGCRQAHAGRARRRRRGRGRRRALGQRPPRARCSKPGATRRGRAPLQPRHRQAKSRPCVARGPAYTWGQQLQNHT